MIYNNRCEGEEGPTKRVLKTRTYLGFLTIAFVKEISKNLWFLVGPRLRLPRKLILEPSPLELQDRVFP